MVVMVDLIPVSYGIAPLMSNHKGSSHALVYILVEPLPILEEADFAPPVGTSSSLEYPVHHDVYHPTVGADGIPLVIRDKPPDLHVRDSTTHEPFRMRMAAAVGFCRSRCRDRSSHREYATPFPASTARETRASPTLPLPCQRGSPSLKTASFGLSKVVISKW